MDVLPVWRAVIQIANFELAWQSVAANQGCAGVDGETIARFAGHAERYLADLVKAVERGDYRAMPLRQIVIPKPDGGQRCLGVPTVRDRIVQQAVLQVIQPLLDRQFERCSFAYRPGRSHLMAVDQVSYWRGQGYTWVLDGDIVQYFDRIQHQRLLMELQERLTAVDADSMRRILDWIRDWITAGLLSAEGICLPERGIPQGAVISPILANLYLDDLDELLMAQGLKLVRYADDFVVLTKTQQQAEQARAIVAQALQAMGLELHPEKTQITTFRRGFRFLGHLFVGEVVVKAPRPKEPIAPERNQPSLRLVYREDGVKPTVMEQALVEALRRAEKPIPPPLFVVLGYEVREKQSVVICSNEIYWRTDMSTLYLMQQGARLAQQQDRFVVEVGQRQPKPIELEVPMREVKHVLVFGNVQVTTAAISSCLDLQIPIIFLTQSGEYKGHLWSAEAANMVLQTAQFRRQQDEEFQRGTARELVRGKLWNSKQLLLRFNRKRQLATVAEAILQIDRLMVLVAKPANCTTLDQIRGYEGAGAAQYFSALNYLIVNPGFELRERRFHPPTDPMNSLLSFGYTLLYNNLFSLLLAEGLNPYLGNLHGAARQNAYLAFDLMEEFRSTIVDSFVMKLVNKKIIRPTDFTFPNQAGGVYLEEPARRIFLKHFEARISEKTSHPDLKEQVSYRRAIQLQVKRYAKAVLGNVKYEAFCR